MEYIGNKDFEYIIINEHSFSIKDQYPVSDGHCLIIPKRHVQTIWELSDEELKDLYDTLLKTCQAAFLNLFNECLLLPALDTAILYLYSKSPIISFHCFCLYVPHHDTIQ